MSGGVFRWGEGDGQAKSVELADVADDLAFGADAVVVEVWSEVAEPGFRVGKQVEDGDRDGAGKGDEGFALAAAAG